MARIKRRRPADQEPGADGSIEATCPAVPTTSEPALHGAHPMHDVQHEARMEDQQQRAAADSSPHATLPRSRRRGSSDKLQQVREVDAAAVSGHLL